MPWSSDAAGYRFPRILYWWSADHWYWIWHLDKRLDFSSCGFEWQLLPLLLLSKSDRFFFLLNWLPYLLVPGIMFLMLRSLRVTGRSARRWMWLLPLGYCYALQAGSVQNDGYSVNYLLASIVFLTGAWRSGSAWQAVLGLLSAALLTGAKLSNLPLMLPLGLLALPTLLKVRLSRPKYALIGLVGLACSCLPLASLSWYHTGDWAGDPQNQWEIRSPNKLGCLTVNLLLQGNQLLQLPVCPFSDQMRTAIYDVVDRGGAFTAWLKHSHPGLATSLGAGDMVYEGGAGPGFGLAAYVFCALLFGAVLRPGKRPKAGSPAASNAGWATAGLFPALWRWGPHATWFSLLVYFSMMATSHTPRIAAPYYPLLLVSLLRASSIVRFERGKLSQWIAVLAGLTVLPLIVLTPVRPLIPLSTVTWLKHSFPSNGMIANIEGKYQAWANLRDDLAKIREGLPPGVREIGFAGAFQDTSYGLWKPLGSRVIVELGLPAKSGKMPPRSLRYAVVTERGVKERYDMALVEWLKQANGTIESKFVRTAQFEASDVLVDTWYLVKFP